MKWGFLMVRPTASRTVETGSIPVSSTIFGFQEKEVSAWMPPFSTASRTVCIIAYLVNRLKIALFAVYNLRSVGGVGGLDGCGAFHAVSFKEFAGVAQRHAVAVALIWMTAR